MTKKTITIRKVGKMDVDNEGMPFMQDYVYPKRNDFIGEPMVKRVQEGDSIKIASYAWAYRWDYDKVLQTSYA